MGARPRSLEQQLTAQGNELSALLRRVEAVSARFEESPEPMEAARSQQHGVAFRVTGVPKQARVTLSWTEAPSGHENWTVTDKNSQLKVVLGRTTRAVRWTATVEKSGYTCRPSSGVVRTASGWTTVNVRVVRSSVDDPGAFSYGFTNGFE